ncbi:iron dependent repressor, metal binding and dimerization domain protein [Paenibacillus humicus]|uniref:iron dependent repressor, metal binding and dimerization domain protein n=1 Tax=Paenibacillus humicus TaxID=412861 RepID=UPI003F13B223
MLTSNMEVYIKAIYLLSQKDKKHFRVSDVAEALLVQSPSASRMATKLKDNGYVEYEKYGRISLTTKGRNIGKKLVYRQGVLDRFLTHIGVPGEQVQKEVRQLEHHISWNTLELIANLLISLEEKQNFR